MGKISLSIQLIFVVSAVCHSTAYAAEMEIADRLSVDGSSLFKSTAVFSGNVGIGTTNPSTALVVNGTITANLFSGDGTSLTGITAAQVGAVADNGSVSPTNLLSNGDFESWSAGASVAPDLWTQVRGIVARESSIIKLGAYSVKLVNGASGDSYLYEDVSTSKGINYWKGKTITMGCWVYATVAGRAGLLINDGVTDSVSSQHTGDSTWQWITLTKTLSGSATRIWTLVRIADGDSQTSYFDGCMAVEGASAFAFSPKPNDYGLVVRPEPMAYDYNETGSKAVLNTDGNWHDLDLSAIVPVGAKAILLKVQIYNNAAGNEIHFRKKGNTATYNVVSAGTQAANITDFAELIVPCDTGRVIQYLGTNVSFTALQIVIIGWFI